MIFVTLGTHELEFKRLLNYLEEMDIKEEVVIQSGNTKFDSKKYTNDINKYILYYVAKI